MSWADMMKAAAREAGRTAPALKTVVGAPWIWNRGDVWLARVVKNRESVVGISARGASIPARQDTTQAG